MSLVHRTRTVVFTLVALLAIGATAFLLYWFSQKPVYLLPKTARGNQLEDYIPQKANLIFAFDATDPQLSETLKKTAGYTTDELKKMFADQLAQDEKFPKEVAAQITTATQFIMAGTVPFLYSFTPDAIEAFKSTSQTSEGKPNFVFITEVEDPSPIAAAVVELQKTDENTLSYKQVGSVVIFSTQTQAELDTALNTPAYLHKSFGYKKSFKNLAGSLPLKRFGALYVDQNSLKENKEGAESSDEKDEKNATPSAELVAVASMSSEGVVFDAFSSVLPLNMHRKLIELAKTPHENLLTQVPTAGVLLAGEAYGLADVFAYDPLFTAFVKGTLTMDYDRDLRPLLKKSSAVVLSDAGSVIPALSFYNEIDSVEDAKPFMSKLDSLLANVITFANFSVKTDPVQGPFIERSPVMNKGIVATTLTAHPERVSAEVNMDASLLSLIKMLQLTYGTATLNGKIISFVSTQPGILDALQNPALMGKGIEPLTQYVAATGLNGQSFYIDVDTFGLFVSRIFTEFAKTLPEADRIDLQAVGISVQKTLTNFDGLFGVSGANNEHLINKGLLKIKIL